MQHLSKLLLIVTTLSCSKTELIKTNPDRLLRHDSFSQIVRIESGKLLFLSGQVALDTNGKLQGQDFASQLDHALQNVSIALEAAASDWSKVVHMRIYVVDLHVEHRILINMALKKLYASGSPPSSTLLGIQSLARKDLRVEVEVIAVAY